MVVSLTRNRHTFNVSRLKNIKANSMTVKQSSVDNTIPIPSSCCQSILVLTESSKATNGTLYCFERDGTDTEWISSNDKIPVAIGRDGLAWGLGLHDDTNISNLPMKEEGDGRSPAGVFNLISVFGYKSADQMKDLKMPYICFR